mmetsp:Transcript_35309/g.70197  ORF Transcript_35309/g.70197 Transcript_35309/m.70197 type:complete len:328 (-) Transcript_35309:813-1796(-)
MGRGTRHVLCASAPWSRTLSTSDRPPSLADGRRRPSARKHDSDWCLPCRTLCRLLLRCPLLQSLQLVLQLPHLPLVLQLLLAKALDEVVHQSRQLVDAVVLPRVFRVLLGLILEGAGPEARVQILPERGHDEDDEERHGEDEHSARVELQKLPHLAGADRSHVQHALLPQVLVLIQQTIKIHIQAVLEHVPQQARRGVLELPSECCAEVVHDGGEVGVQCPQHDEQLSKEDAGQQQNARQLDDSMRAVAMPQDAALRSQGRPTEQALDECGKKEAPPASCSWLVGIWRPDGLRVQEDKIKVVDRLEVENVRAKLEPTRSQIDDECNC